VYDWDYARQLLHLRAAEASGETEGRTADALEADLYQERFLVKRAVLRAIDHREGTGHCLIHGDRPLTTYETLPLPKELGPARENKHACVDCGGRVKAEGSRCSPCSAIHLSKERTGKQTKRHAWQLGSLARRNHDWVMPK
jgi:hypothetical protein